MSATNGMNIKINRKGKCRYIFKFLIYYVSLFQIQFLFKKILYPSLGITLKLKYLSILMMIF